jgi:hypothetical protein
MTLAVVITSSISAEGGSSSRFGASYVQDFVNGTIDPRCAKKIFDRCIRFKPNFLFSFWFLAVIF